MLCRVRSRQHDDFIHHATQIHVLKVQVARPREVHQDLYDAIQAMDLVVDDVHVTASVGIDLLQLCLQQLQVQDDGVDRILHLVSHAASKATASGEATGSLDLVFNLPNGLRVTQGHKSANLVAALLNKVEGKLHAPPGRRLDLTLNYSPSRAKRLKNDRP